MQRCASWLRNKHFALQETDVSGRREQLLQKMYFTVRRYRNSLRDGRFGVRTPMRARLLGKFLNLFHCHLQCSLHTQLPYLVELGFVLILSCRQPIFHCSHTILICIHIIFIWYFIYLTLLLLLSVKTVELKILKKKKKNLSNLQLRYISVESKHKYNLTHNCLFNQSEHVLCVTTCKAT